MLHATAGYTSATSPDGAIEQGGANPALEVVCYASSSDDDEDTDDSNKVDAPVGPGRIRERLSTMFEHNDLINNRMAALAQAIREGPLRPSARLAGRASRVGSIDSVGFTEDRNATGKEEGDICKQSSTASAGGDAQVSRRSSSRRRSSVSWADRCLALEEMLEQLENENHSLRTQLETHNSQVEAKASKDRATSGADFLVASPALIAPGPAAHAGSTQGSSAGDPEAVMISTTSAMTATTPAMSSRASVFQDRRHQRRERLQCHGFKDTMQFKRLEKENKSLRTELEKCESIIEQLIQELETITCNGDKHSADVVSKAQAEARGIIIAAGKRAEKTEQSIDYVEDLKNAVSGFFGALGIGVEAPTHLTVAASAAADSPQWNRVRSKGASEITKLAK
eukprot:TRINITY_DN107798_c0_g1_i1.p1 TRINITY_DN107798_c0_g1~~TRINITY_DN107798_c0_g1_i1.p1  ORF type:complete len:397 (-),score=84.87 TRINITY_DN107798_c0_g1_i1:29-1219(-)